ncbi:toll-like receptor 9 [Chanos chanos]|uniref:Toll-like receptor 9 n=1 Tax=Chanos chanos TaxID=29144 RepID=A0A6J2W681_CHACN|nr:toll-like receptor 9 [Chanos chanos]
MFILGIIVFLICYQAPLVNTANPKFFPCDDKITWHGDFSVDCQQRNLTRVPRIKSLSVVSLNLDGNRIRQIKHDDFTGIPNLQSLSLSWNCLPDRLKSLHTPSCNLTIDPNAFVSLKNLSSLLLAGNSLTSIPLLPEHLRILGLEYNHLFYIDQPLGTPFLKQLLLAKNCYYANPCNQAFFISPRVFQDLPELQNLTLGFSNVTYIPTNLPRSLESLDLQENNITEITEDSFANLTRLYYLDLAWNCQRCDHAAQPCFPCPNDTALQLHPRAFHGQAESLTTLSLRGNSLRSITHGLFAPLKKLQTLDLSDNLLAYPIQNGTFFQELPKVQSLNLRYNYEPLKSFSELVLSPSIGKMTSLRYLFLSGFFFHQLTNRSIEHLIRLPGLEYLELRMNFINSCNMSALNQLKALKKVVLSQNMISFNPCSSAKHTEWQSNPLIQVNRENDQTRNLVDSDNERLQSGQEIGGEDACPLGYSMKFFQAQLCKKKIFFDLSQNNIPLLNASVFRGIEKAECLDLSYNYMSQTLNGQQFSPLSNLSYLNLAYNRIDLYFEEAFQELAPTLKALDLSNNEFHFLMRGMGHNFTFLKKLTSLEALSLSNNNIGIRISKNLTSASLKYLFFSGNRLDIMWDSRGDQYLHFFQNLTNLTHLDISQNQLISFSPEAFINLPPSLRVLRVDSNLLNYFPWRNISVLGKLCYLNLSGNHLSDLPDIAIQFGPNLTSLDLSHNRINAIPEAFFSQATALKNLMLNNNQLMTLEFLSFPPAVRGVTDICHRLPCKLTLHVNPFTCSCSSSWFAEFLRKTPVNVPHLTTDVRCEFPESQRGVNVLSIDPRSCQEIFGSVAFLSTLLLIILVTSLPLMRHLYGWDLWYCIQILWAGHKGYTPLNGNSKEDGQFDAFVVFDTKNQAVRDWIYNEMIINLETSGRRRFRLCLEERDWVPGVSCIENLHNAVYNSKKTVFILTNPNGYARVSGVVRQSFLLVQQRLLDEKVDVAVLVLLDPLFPKLKYLQMRKRLCKKSVVSWSRNPRAQPLFWNHLRMSLASDNKQFYDKNIMESFLSHDLL